MLVVRNIYAGAALTAAIVLGLLSFLSTKDITGNVLILIAQFLLYSLTLLGFGEVVKYITQALNKAKK